MEGRRGMGRGGREHRWLTGLLSGYVGPGRHELEAGFAGVIVWHVFFFRGVIEVKIEIQSECIKGLDGLKTLAFLSGGTSMRTLRFPFCTTPWLTTLAGTTSSSSIPTPSASSSPSHMLMSSSGGTAVGCGMRDLCGWSRYLLIDGDSFLGGGDELEKVRAAGLAQLRICEFGSEVRNAIPDGIEVVVPGEVLENCDMDICCIHASLDTFPGLVERAIMEKERLAEAGCGWL